MAEVLRENGYATAWFGKNHNVPIWEATPTGPFTHWPIGEGYDYFYGFVGGDTSQWQPGNLFRNMTPIHPYNGNPGWNLVTASICPVWCNHTPRSMISSRRRTGCLPW